MNKAMLLSFSAARLIKVPIECVLGNSVSRKIRYPFNVFSSHSRTRSALVFIDHSSLS
ncbi:MAG: hypothetical protein PHQ23_10515 [Candidatus Wallbacteria bacterium]|nr:hypothetical protein [Candidatus Wallbacteria bacterium]